MVERSICIKNIKRSDSLAGVRRLGRSVFLLASFSLVPIETTADLDGRKIAFVTSAHGSADLGSWPGADPDTTGLIAADSICANLAADAGLSNASSFVAFLSDSIDDAYFRINNFSGKKDESCVQGALPA